MDISELKQIADAAFDHIVYRKQLRERIQSGLLFTYNNGMFKATTELISFVSVWTSSRPLFLEDIHNNPIHIVDKEFFLQKCCDCYQEQMNAWHIEFEQSKKIRKGRDLV
jgi:hypothetical protein